jgi:hypothetical protein
MHCEELVLAGLIGVVVRLSSWKGSLALRQIVFATTSPGSFRPHSARFVVACHASKQAPESVGWFEPCRRRPSVSLATER